MDISKEGLIDLRKKTIIDLKKEQGIENLVAQVVLVLDCSGSMDHLFDSGNVQETINRILPIGLGFDDNESVDVFLFHNRVLQMKENLTRQNVFNYVDLIRRTGFLYGGTDYAPAVREVVSKFSKKGFFSKSKKMDMPVYVIFITDGECIDKQETDRAIRDASDHAIYFQFVGIGSADFYYLNKLDNLSGRNIDNAGFLKVADMTKGDDKQVYTDLMKEFPTFVSQAKQKGML